MAGPIYPHWHWRKVLRQCSIVLVATLLMLPVAMGSAIATGIADVPLVRAGSPTKLIDQGEVLSLLNKNALDKKLTKLAETTGNEVRFVTIRRFDYGLTAPTFTNELFERWFPTPETQAKQTLILLDTQTKTTGIRTGDEVKRIMTDDVAQSIAEETMLPPIREGNYNQGFLDAANRLSLVLSGESDPGPPEIKVVEVESTFTKAEETDDKSASIIVVVLLLAATIIPMATYYWYQRD
ncbi:photosystem II repair protein Psb32 [Altericista sp. CCNU0014]|uniref:photosystem II repair protein Psb32 n=1 Tax=Altericista sp. CCNU0014 TaxID=3082949 RepID=UPI0038512609